MHSDQYFRQSADKLGPSERYKDKILYDMENLYREAIWQLPDDFLSRSRYEEVLRRLDMNSSPGLPYLREAPTNRLWLEFDGMNFSTYKVDRMWHDVQQLVENPRPNLLRVFVKQEPHKKSKVQEGRWRLIMAASLDVQILWHMCFDYMNDKEIVNSYFLPSQQGIVLVGGGWKQYRDQWEAAGLEWGLDKSAWDWTAPYWALKLDLEFRFRMGRGRLMDKWYHLACRLYAEMFENPYLALSDGSVYQQIVPGVMKSGCVNTISTNSHCQVFMHLLYCYETNEQIYPVCRACGDDTLQHPRHCQDLSVYSKYGVIVKSASESLEFVGHEFTRAGPHPLYMAKHIKKAAYVAEDNLAQYLDSMARMYVHTRYFDIWQELAFSLGLDLPLSRQAYLHWYDFEE